MQYSAAPRLKVGPRVQVQEVQLGVVVNAPQVPPGGLQLAAACDYYQIKAWALEGARIGESLGRGGGCAHTRTQEPSQPYAIC